MIAQCHDGLGVSCEKAEGDRSQQMLTSPITFVVPKADLAVRTYLNQACDTIIGVP